MLKNSKRKNHPTKYSFDIVTIGSSLRDTAFFSNELRIIDNPIKDPLCEKLIAVEYGAKIQSDTVHVGFGGGAGNTAMNLAHLGMSSAIISSVGSDLDGRAIIEHYREFGIDTRLMQETNRATTGFSFITVQPKKADRTMYVHYGATKKLHVTPAILEPIQAQWYYISSLNHLAWKQTVAAVSKTQTAVAWNPGSEQPKSAASVLKRLVRDVTLLILNRNEATEFLVKCGYPNREYALEELVTELYTFGPKIILITDGKNGAIARRDDEVVFHAAGDGLPVDTSGAGDCFGSSFVTGLIRYNGNIARSLELAQYVVDRLLQKPGAQNGFTTWERLPKKFKKT